MVYYGLYIFFKYIVILINDLGEYVWFQIINIIIYIHLILF